MRVLHIQKAAGISGSERHLLQLLPGLAARGVDVRMLMLAKEDPFADAMREAGVETVLTPAGPDLNPLLVPRIRREILGWKADLVHTHLIHADIHGQAAAGVARVPAVSTVHSSQPYYSRQPYKAVLRWAGHRPRRVIAISEFVAQHQVSSGLVRPEDVRVVLYGVDTDSFRVDEATRVAARDRFGVKPGEIVVGTASRLVPFKGHDTALRAVFRARQQAPNVRLLIAGDGSLRDDLERQAIELGMGEDAVRFLGFVPDVGSFFAACDVVLFLTQPGFGEGFGLAALEAMAAGRPVIGTRVASVPEVIGGEGPLVESDDSDAVAELIVRFAGNPEELRRAGVAAFERARDVFSVDAMVEGVLDVYGEVVGLGSEGG